MRLLGEIFRPSRNQVTCGWGKLAMRGARMTAASPWDTLCCVSLSSKLPMSAERAGEHTRGWGGQQRARGAGGMLTGAPGSARCPLPSLGGPDPRGCSCVPEAALAAGSVPTAAQPHDPGTTAAPGTRLGQPVSPPCPAGHGLGAQSGGGKQREAGCMGEGGQGIFIDFL